MLKHGFRLPSFCKYQCCMQGFYVNGKNLFYGLLFPLSNILAKDVYVSVVKQNFSYTIVVNRSRVFVNEPCWAKI